MRTRIGNLSVGDATTSAALKSIRRELSEVFQGGFLRIRSARETDAPRESLFFSRDRNKIVYKTEVGEIVELS
jgi:hypothetical protein